jgi:hypothetical protein
MPKYQIGDKVYLQKPLVLGQIDQLMDLLEGTQIPKSSNPWMIKKALGEKIYVAMAIVLVEEGKSPKRDLEELQKNADEIRWSIDHLTSIGVIEDFFECNPIASLLERLAGAMLKSGQKISVGLRGPLPSSATETSPNETKSSGDSPPENANLS